MRLCHAQEDLEVSGTWWDFLARVLIDCLEELHINVYLVLSTPPTFLS